MKGVNLVVISIVVSCLTGCGSSGSGPNQDAIPYATFGQVVDNVIPQGLKSVGTNADISALLEKTLSGSCSADYTDCPYVTADGGADAPTGEILMRIWGLDYGDECTDALLAEGTCFDCPDCLTGSVGTTKFIKPTMIANPTSCANSTMGRYVNLGTDPCFFDKMIGQISNIKDCETVQGNDLDISTAVPWYSSWGLSKNVKFSSYYSDDDGGGIWWTVNAGNAGNEQYFLSLDSNWVYMGIKDVPNDKFLFLGSGSPQYFATLGEGTGVNVSAYAGPLSGIPTEFEAIQVRVQDPNRYIERLRSNGSYLWYQSWSGDSFPNTPVDVDTVKNSPVITRCLKIGEGIATSKYVPFSECMTSFGAADVSAINLDSNYTLKIIDGQTASSINFSSALTPTTDTSCLPEEAGQ